MARWVAVSYGAFDVRGLDIFGGALDYLILAVHPSEPLGLVGEPAELWRRLLAGPVSDEGLSDAQQQLVREFAEVGIASDQVGHIARMNIVSAPWLLSPMHELVYALVASLARDAAIDVVMIKGPIQYRQGLREHEHSGDVDVWVDPHCIDQAAKLLEAWGWRSDADIGVGFSFNHSLTLAPGAWGCEIDLHRRFPGSTLSDEAQFAEVLSRTESIEFAGVNVRVPEKTTHAVIAGLHLVRPEIAEQIAQRATRGAEVLRTAGPGTVEASSRLGADAALVHSLRAAFPEREFADPGVMPLDWVWRSKSTRAQAYLAVFSELPWGQRPGFVWRLLWPSAAAVRHSEKLSGRHSRTVLGARILRFWRGLSNFWLSR